MTQTIDRGMATSTRGYKNALFAKWADRAAELDEVFRRWQNGPTVAEIDEAWRLNEALTRIRNRSSELDTAFYDKWAAELDEVFYDEWAEEAYYYDECDEEPYPEWNDRDQECSYRDQWSPGYKACTG